MCHCTFGYTSHSKRFEKRINYVKRSISYLLASHKAQRLIVFLKNRLQQSYFVFILSFDKADEHQTGNSKK